MAKVSSNPAQLLLDTHALLWWASDDERLSRKVKRLIQNRSARIFVSAATAWEIATKVRLGKLQWSASGAVETYCLGQEFDLLPISFAHAEKAGSWPQAHGDPFDRMLAAQSQIERIALATDDPMIRLFGVDTIW
jgi:PIN domain nuclease of toxin-antitoxin system